jgi:hypothetical protein
MRKQKTLEQQRLNAKTGYTTQGAPKPISREALMQTIENLSTTVAGLEAKRTWLNVEDITPTMPFQNHDGRYSQSVLAFIQGGFMRVCWYHDYRWEICGSDHIVADVLYWMDLPDLPPL